MKDLNIVDRYIEVSRFRTDLIALCYKHYKKLIGGELELHEITYKHEETSISFWNNEGEFCLKSFQNGHLVFLLRDICYEEH